MALFHAFTICRIRRWFGCLIFWTVWKLVEKYGQLPQLILGQTLHPRSQGSDHLVPVHALLLSVERPAVFAQFLYSTIGIPVQ